MLATPNTLTAKTRCHSSGVDATTSPTAPMPALLHSTSMRPCSATIRASRRRRSRPGRRHVDAVEQVEPDDDVAGRGEARRRWPSRSRRSTRSPRRPVPPSLRSPSRRGSSNMPLAMTRITGARTLDVRAPTSHHARRLRRRAPGPRLLGRVRVPRDRRPARGRRHDVHDRSRQRPVLRGDRAARAAGRRPRARGARRRRRRRSGAGSPTTASSAGSGRRRA